MENRYTALGLNRGQKLSLAGAGLGCALSFGSMAISTNTGPPETTVPETVVRLYSGREELYEMVSKPLRDPQYIDRLDTAYKSFRALVDDEDVRRQLKEYIDVSDRNSKDRYKHHAYFRLPIFGGFGIFLFSLAGLGFTTPLTSRIKNQETCQR